MVFEVVKATREDTLSREVRESAVIPIKESTEMAETIRELNDDKVEDKFSAIDMKTRLHQIEISSIIALDSLVAFSFLPSEVSNITRSKKRLAVSLNGLGRSEIVSIAQGMQERKQGRSIFDRIGSLFGGGSQ